MTIQINKVHYPVKVLGPGTRVGIWVQGCSLGCRACIAVDTWPPDGGQTIEVGGLIAECRELSGDVLDGVTISGGEPFEQPDSLTLLIAAIREWSSELSSPLDILCYSGFTTDRLLEEHPDLVAALDAVIPGPYIDQRNDDDGWRGSRNQELLLPTSLGTERYQREASDAFSPGVQVTVEDGAVWMVGIPGAGDMDRLEEYCLERGIELGGVSWRP